MQEKIELYLAISLADRHGNIIKRIITPLQYNALEEIDKADYQKTTPDQIVRISKELREKLLDNLDNQEWDWLVKEYPPSIALEKIISQCDKGKKAEWVKAFDREELIEFISEIVKADQHNIEAIIHEWYESAIFIQHSKSRDILKREKTKELPLAEKQDFIVNRPIPE
jgi:hypothetical protein